MSEEILAPWLQSRRGWEGEEWGEGRGGFWHHIALLSVLLTLLEGGGGQVGAQGRREDEAWVSR